MTPAERRILLGALGFLSFGAVYANVVVAPVLTQIAREFEVSIGTAGLVVAAYGLPGIVTGSSRDRSRTVSAASPSSSGEVHRLTPGVAATVTLTLGVGALVGSQIGGRLGDRLGHRRVVWTSIAISAVLLLALTNLPLPLAAAAGLNLVLSAVIGARFTTNTALMGEQVPEARGTMLAVTASVVSLAMVVGAVVGGLIIDGPGGFPALGLACATVGLASTAIVLLFVREEPIDLEAQLA